MVEGLAAHAGRADAKPDRRLKRGGAETLAVRAFSDDPAPMGVRVQGDAAHQHHQAFNIPFHARGVIAAEFGLGRATNP